LLLGSRIVQRNRWRPELYLARQYRHVKTADCQRWQLNGVCCSTFVSKTGQRLKPISVVTRRDAI